MVRFSDMLGGNGDQERPRRIVAPEPAWSDDIPEPQPEPEGDEPGTDIPSETVAPGDEADVARQSPEDVLDRLTQYATSARASDADPAPEGTPPEVPTADHSQGVPDELAAVGDDLLPHAKADTRKRRRK